MLFSSVSSSSSPISSSAALPGSLLEDRNWHKAPCVSACTYHIHLYSHSQVKKWQLAFTANTLLKFWSRQIIDLFHKNQLSSVVQRELRRLSPLWYVQRVVTRDVVSQAVSHISDHLICDLPFSLFVNINALASLFMSFSHFLCTEDDPQPDCRRLFRQRSICHGEFLLSVSLNAQIFFFFFYDLEVGEKCLSALFCPSFTQGESHPEGSLCDFQAWWLTYFGKS